MTHTVGQGGTLRLYGVYRDGTSALVDPVSPTVEVRNPTGTPVVSGATPERSGVGNYFYNFTAAPTAPMGVWTIVWGGTINGVAVQGEEEFEVVAAGSINVTDPDAALANLVSLEDYKRAIKEVGTENDQYHQDALWAAATACAAFCDRDFATQLVTEDRTFHYDGSGFLEIDDAASINWIAYENASPLNPTAWEVLKDGPPAVPYSYLRLPALGGRYSGEMGFTRNADTYNASHPYEVRVVVNAVWGWPTVPLDIQRAIIWTAAYYETLSDTGGLLASESVADVAKSYAFQGVLAANTVEDDDIPPRAKAILAKYRRHVL